MCCCVVKTYPSIDPHSAPPPRINMHIYKCQINSIACCDVATSQHVSLILSGGNQNDLVRQRHVYIISVSGIVSAESTRNKLYPTRSVLSQYESIGKDDIYHSCTVLWVLFRVPTTTHFNKMCCCMVLWVLRPTTPFKMCCCMVLWVLLYGVVGVTTHNTIQQHILLKCVVVGTRNNTHNTIQQHTLLKWVVVGTRNNTHNNIQQHTLLMLLFVCHLWWCGCCFEYPQFTPTSLCCCCVSPMMMWVLLRVPTYEPS